MQTIAKKRFNGRNQASNSKEKEEQWEIRSETALATQEFIQLTKVIQEIVTLDKSKDNVSEDELNTVMDNLRSTQLVKLYEQLSETKVKLHEQLSETKNLLTHEKEKLENALNKFTQEELRCIKKSMSDMSMESTQMDLEEWQDLNNKILCLDSKDVTYLSNTSDHHKALGRLKVDYKQWYHLSEALGKLIEQKSQEKSFQGNQSFNQQYGQQNTQQNQGQQQFVVKALGSTGPQQQFQQNQYNIYNQNLNQQQIQQNQSQVNSFQKGEEDKKNQKNQQATQKR